MLCLASARLARFPLVVDSGAQGAASLSTAAGEWSTQTLPRHGGGTWAAAAGLTAYLQAWHRDAPPTGAHLTDALRLFWY